MTSIKSPANGTIITTAVVENILKKNTSQKIPPMNLKRTKPSKKEIATLKRKRRRLTKKKHKKQLQLQEKRSKNTTNVETIDDTKDIEINYVSEKYSIDSLANTKFAEIMANFTPAEDLFKTKIQLETEAENRMKLQEKQRKAMERKKQESDPIDQSIIDMHQKESNMEIDSNTNQPTDISLNILQSTIDANQTVILSNRMKKEINRPSIAALKKVVERSDLVEEHDCNAFDPYLLLQLKSMRNTIVVPDHWSQKRKYLQGKRGFLKPPFHLPSYIAFTGITDMRESRLQSLDDKSMKQKQRERMRPRKGGLEINYQTLHEAFFKHQTKPQNMSTFGQMYYEGKDATMKYQHFRPGYISDRLKSSLGMVPRYRVVRPSGAVVQQRIEHSEDEVLAGNSAIVGGVEWRDIHTLKYGEYVIWDKNFGSEIYTAGPGKNKRIHICSPISGWVWIRSRDGKEDILKRCDVEDPPPWLINIQRFGLPPAYPELRIPGLNAAIPPNRSYGFHEGQWGKPPVDDNGQPLYGDPFGIWTEPISNSWSKFAHWGTLQKFEESSADEEDTDSEDEDAEDVDIRIPGVIASGALSNVKKKSEVDIGNVSLNGNLIKNSNLLHVHASRLKNITLTNNESGIQSITSGIASDQSHISVRKKHPLLMSGLESPLSSMSTQDLQLRKPELFHVLQPKYNTIQGRFGSSMVYDMSANAMDNISTSKTVENMNMDETEASKQRKTRFGPSSK